MLAVQKFHGEEEALRLANGTPFGLAGGVFTNDGAKAMRVIKKLRAGITWINAYHPTYCEAPWGGYKQSGIGRDLGTYGYEEYTEVKQININLCSRPRRAGLTNNNRIRVSCSIVQGRSATACRQYAQIKYL